MGAMQAGETLVSVGQDTRLNYRVLDIRTPANQGIFRIQSQVGNVRGYDFGLTFLANHGAFFCYFLALPYQDFLFNKYFDWIEVAL